MILKVKKFDDSGWHFIDHVYDLSAHRVRFTQDTKTTERYRGPMRIDLKSLAIILNQNPDEPLLDKDGEKAEVREVFEGIAFDYLELDIPRASDDQLRADQGKMSPTQTSAWLFEFDRRMRRTGDFDRHSDEVTFLMNTEAHLLHDNGDTIESFYSYQ